ncbi:Nardilysin [Gossypium arboreum]|uniref:Nardilysin n=1 Tax=Gossypium arboreum TaxID=29729 RepID=A0A0B0MLS9_GOSAR|nr:Nardilysin [Gossypium arboreum]
MGADYNAEGRITIRFGVQQRAKPFPTLLLAGRTEKKTPDDVEAGRKGLSCETNLLVPL